jgi:F0F1-type ATP synthase membrane subunit b/b'
VKILSKLAFLAIVLSGTAVAAQPTTPPAERDALDTDHHDSPTKVEHEEHGEGDHDPSREFNWTSHPSPFGKGSYNSYDVEGGPMGDGAMGPEKRPLLAGEEEEPMSVPFMFVLFNFGLLLILLGWKAGPIATEMAQKRSDEIKTALDEAARLRNAAKDKLDEYSSKLRTAESEIDQMITTMRETAESDRQRIIAAAEAQAAILQKDAAERIAAEIDRPRAILRQEVVLAASGVAEKLLREKTTATDQSNLVDAFQKDVNDATTLGSGRRPS